MLFLFYFYEQLPAKSVAPLKMTAHQKSKRINIIGHKKRKMSREAFYFFKN